MQNTDARSRGTAGGFPQRSGTINSLIPLLNESFGGQRSGEKGDYLHYTNNAFTNKEEASRILQSIHDTKVSYLQMAISELQGQNRELAQALKKLKRDEGKNTDDHYLANNELKEKVYVLEEKVEKQAQQIKKKDTQVQRLKLARYLLIEVFKQYHLLQKQQSEAQIGILKIWTRVERLLTDSEKYGESDDIAKRLANVVENGYRRLVESMSEHDGLQINQEADAEN